MNDLPAVYVMRQKNEDDARTPKKRNKERIKMKCGMIGCDWFVIGV
jgi:hypothetical protein